jgi:hypothetical protein
MMTLCKGLALGQGECQKFIRRNPRGRAYGESQGRQSAAGEVVKPQVLAAVGLFVSRFPLFADKHDGGRGGR